MNQQHGTKHTVSAAIRFNPTPPALVDIKKTNAPCPLDSESISPEFDWRLKLLIAAKRSSARIDPSRRS